jgi:hypothetical protein
MSQERFAKFLPVRFKRSAAVTTASAARFG